MENASGTRGIKERRKQSCLRRIFIDKGCVVRFGVTTDLDVIEAKIPVTDAIIVIAFNYSNITIAYIFYDTNMVGPASIVARSIIVPIIKDNIANVWCSIFVFYPTRNLFEQFN